MKKALEKAEPEIKKLVEDVCDFIENNLGDVLTEYVMQMWFIERRRIRKWKYKRLLNYVKKHEVK